METVSGLITKALSGFYYVDVGGRTLECRGRGKLRLERLSPLVGDRVAVLDGGDGRGTVMDILPRSNFFVRPAVANLELMVIIASETIPVTDPFLIDRIAVISTLRGCEPIVVVNKLDLSAKSELFDIYSAAGYRSIRCSALTGEGIDELREAIAGRVCAFTGNSGVGKSSILNALDASFGIATGGVSEKLGRGRHTTRHVELFRLQNGALVADTPGFAAFDPQDGALLEKERLQYAFPEFAPYLGRCRYQDCAHLKEQGCAVLAALEEGRLAPSRHASYVRLYEQAGLIKEWEHRDKTSP